MAGTATISTIKHDVTGAATRFNDGSGNEIGQLVKSWLSYNGSSPAVRGSFNVSSVTKGGTGDYTVNFTNTLTDANYSVVTASGNDNTANAGLRGLNPLETQTAPTSSAIRIGSWVCPTGTRTVEDTSYANVTVNR